MPTADPIMDVVDRLPLGAGSRAEPTRTPPAGPLPFGLRFAVAPLAPCDKHKKTYYTVTVKEATQVSRDGKVVTEQDDVQRERED